MPYGFKGETPRKTRKVDEMVKAMIAEGMDKDKAYAIAIDKVKSMKFKKKKKAMGEKLFLVDSGSEIELSDKTFRKQVLRFGKWEYGGDIFEVSKELVSKLIQNFKERVWQNVPITRGHQENQRLEENPELVVGYVTDLVMTDEGLDAVFEVQNADEVGKKYRDVSAGILDSYRDHESGAEKGSVLTHIALVVEPYIKALKPFVALSEIKNATVIHLEDKLNDEAMEEKPVVETATDSVEEVVVTEEIKEVEKAVESQEVKPEAEAKVEVTDETVKEAEVEQKVELTEAVSEDLSKKLSETQEREKKLAEKVHKLEAEAKLEKLLAEGRITPAVRETALQLLSAKSQTINLGEQSKSVAVLFEEFLMKLPKMVNFEEQGITVDDSVETDPLASLSEQELEGFKKLHRSDWKEKALEYVAKYGKTEAQKEQAKANLN